MRKTIYNKNIYNIPNFLTMLRVVLTFVLIYMFLKLYPPLNILIVFIIAALTDFFDGQIARRFDCVTLFGERADILADRFLWITSGILMITTFSISGFFDNIHTFLMVLIFTREIITGPFALFLLILGKNFMSKSVWQGKLTTFLQGVAIPSLILAEYFSQLYCLSIILSILCFIAGLISAIGYLKQVNVLKK